MWYWDRVEGVICNQRNYVCRPVLETNTEGYVHIYSDDDKRSCAYFRLVGSVIKIISAADRIPITHSSCVRPRSGQPY